MELSGWLEIVQRKRLAASSRLANHLRIGYFQLFKKLPKQLIDLIPAFFAENCIIIMLVEQAFGAYLRVFGRCWFNYFGGNNSGRNCNNCVSNYHYYTRHKLPERGLRADIAVTNRG